MKDLPKMILKIVFTEIILSTQLVPAHSSPEEKCLDTSIHKEFPSAEGSDFVACLPWKSRSCCSADTVKKLKSSGSGLHHNDWDYCGKMSQSCRKFLMSDACFYYCDPNLIKWRAVNGGLISRVPVCSHTCDEWFEACKNDMTYSSNWLDSYVEGNFRKAPVKFKRTCRTFAEIFHNGEGLCNKIWGPSLKYETSPNCFVFDFKGENPNDKVTKT